VTDDRHIFVYARVIWHKQNRADVAQPRQARVWYGHEHDPACRADLARVISRFGPVPGHAELAVYDDPAKQNTSPRSYLRLTWSNRDRILGPTVPTNVYFAWGINEQFLAIFPTEKLVVVRLGAGPRSDPAFRIEFFKRVVGAL
jgi:CubicO group peptidase (beta-lactamase class C family)